MGFSKIGIVGGLNAALAFSASPAAAGEIVVPGFGGSYATVEVDSLKKRQHAFIVQQQFDFSCGSAALATLLTYHYDQPTSEQDAFLEMWQRGDQEKIREVGFSMLDMKKYLELEGFQADGFKIGLDKLADIGVPAIALIDTNGYKHFVVIKGISDHEVLVGDPALGLKVMRRSAFEEIWNNIVFVIRNQVDEGRERFNEGRQWRTYTRAPLGHPISDETLQSLTTHQWGKALNIF